MYYHSSSAAKGDQGNRYRHLMSRSTQRAPVNIYKTATSYEMLVFAPGRIKEHFRLNRQGNQLTVSYLPPEGFPRPDWIAREYSRGGFERSFTLNESIDGDTIQAKYEDGVLYISLPLIPGKEAVQQEISID